MKLRYYLLLIPFVSFILGSTAYSQKERSFTISYNKDYLWSFKSNNGGFIKHTWGLDKGWYFSSGLGFWAWERNTIGILDIENPDLLITIFPEYDFALREVVPATDGRVGFTQRHTHWSMEMHVPFFVTFGRTWLRKSRRFYLDTDIGLLASYYHNDFYGWGDVIAIESGLAITDPPFANEHGDPVYIMKGKAVQANIEPGISMNLETTYYLNDHLGIGINIFMGMYIFYGGYSTYGFHFKYRY